MTTTKNTLTLKEFMLFVNDVFNAVFLENEDGSVTYVPELYDYAMRMNLWRYYYAGEETGNLEQDYNTLLELRLMSDELFESGVSEEQYCALEEAIQEKIEFRKEKLIAGEKKDGLEQLIALAGQQMAEKRDVDAETNENPATVA